jgi:glycerophosphoryl diester phosphodiesterase
VDARVAALTLPELRALEVGSWRGERWRGERIPTLREALAVVSRAGEGRRLLIEIKSGPETIPAIATAFAAAGCDAALAVLMSFDPAVTAEARRRLPGVERHWLTDERGPVERLCARARSAGCSALNVDRTLPIDRAFVATAHASGLKVFVWTVDDAAEARRLLAAGVDGLTTNRPGALRGEL